MNPGTRVRANGARPECTVITPEEYFRLTNADSSQHPVWLGQVWVIEDGKPSSNLVWGCAEYMLVPV